MGSERVAYRWWVFVTVQGMTAPAAGAVLSIVMWAYVPGTFILPTLSDRIGLRKAFYFPSMLTTAILIVVAAYALGVSLWIIAALWGFMGLAPQRLRL